MVAPDVRRMNSTLIVGIAGPIIGGIIALFSVKIAQRHNRDVKILEIREQTVRTLRQEKREAYLELLRVNRMSAQYATQLGYMALGQQLQVNPNALVAASEKYKDLIPELEIVASGRIYDLAQQLYTAASQCQDTMFRESEQRFQEYERNNPNQEPSPEQKAAIWEEVRAKVQKVFEGQGIVQLYFQLRNQIKQELGFLALDPKLVPSPEELEKLRQEFAKRDQLLRHHS